MCPWERVEVSHPSQLLRANSSYMRFLRPKKKQKKGKRGEEESSEEKADDLEGISEKNVMKGKRVSKMPGGFYTQLHQGGEAG